MMRRNRGLSSDPLVFTLQLRKTSARRPSEKALRPVIASKGISHLQMTSVGSHAMSGMEKEGKDREDSNQRNHIKQYEVYIIYRPNISLFRALLLGLK